MGLVEVFLAWDKLARDNVNRRAAELGWENLKVGYRVIKAVPKTPAKMAVPAAIDWAAASKYVRYAAPVFAWKPVIAVSRALTGAAGAAGAAGGAATANAAPTAMAAVSPVNALLLAAGSVGIERLVFLTIGRTLRLRPIGPPESTRLSSLQDGRCLLSAPLRFASCADGPEWKLERLAPGVPLTGHKVLGLVHGADGSRLFVVRPAATSSTASTASP